jgi:hypothetical protein
MYVYVCVCYVCVYAERNHQKMHESWNESFMYVNVCMYVCVYAERNHEEMHVHEMEVSCTYMHVCVCAERGQKKMHDFEHAVFMCVFVYVQVAQPSKCIGSFCVRARSRAG